jgi:methionine aminotransferase
MQFEGNISSKFPKLGTTIFTVMSAMAKEHDAINLSQGFPEYQPDSRLLQAFESALRSGNHQYAPMAGWLPLREAIAAKTEKLYGQNVDPEMEITITAGGTQAIFTAIAAVIHEGDEVIVFAPAYDCYAPAIELVGGRPVFYNLSAPDFKIEWEKVKKLITSKTKLIIINSPHNPTAKVFSPTDLEALEHMVKGTNIMLLSDEVYEHITFDSKPHQSVLSRKLLAERSFVVSSFGKTYHCTGWKVGYVIAPQNLMQEFRKVHQYNVFSVSTPAQVAFAEILKEEDMYLSLSSFYEAKRNFFRDALKASRFGLLDCEGTYFQLASYDQISDAKDVEFAKWLTVEKRVASIPISVFYSHTPDSKVIRFCFAKEEETLKRAAEWLSKI